MGDTQQKKTTYYVNFKVTQGRGYNIIFGYSLLSSMKVNIECGRDRITYFTTPSSQGPRLMIHSKLYPCSMVHLSVAAKQVR